MKTQILLGVGLCFLSYTSKAQSKLIFNHDLAGNQIKYQYCKGSDCDTQRTSKEEIVAEKPEILDDPSLNLEESFRIYPNPSTDIIYANWIIEGNPDLIGVEILDISGKILKLSFSKTSQGTQILLTELAKGVYFIKFSFDNSSQITRKILKN